MFRYSSVKAADETAKAGYVMQFMWRDATSSFDVIGPYYSSVNGLASHKLHGALFETLEWLDLHGFATFCISSDAASANMTLYDELGVTVKKPWFKNPHGDMPVFVYPDPPHMLKSLRNALYISLDLYLYLSIYLSIVMQCMKCRIVFILYR